MRPSMYADVMTVDYASLCLQWPAKYVGTDVHQRCFLTICLPKIVEGVMGAIGTVVECVAICVRFRTGYNILRQCFYLKFSFGSRAMRDSPPTIRIIDGIVSCG